PAQLKVLAVLSYSPRGRRSAEQIAGITGQRVSTVSRALTPLLRQKLVLRVPRRDHPDGSGRLHYVWLGHRAAWPNELREPVAAVPLPGLRASATGAIPEEFFNLDWPKHPALYDIREDAVAIAHRLADV